jgi:acyl dehydratase
MPEELLYLDGLAAGQVYVARGRSEPLSVEAIKSYAAQYDPQPFHLNEADAVASLFGGLAASGWQTASLTMALLVRYGPKLAGGIIGAGLDELRWPRPVRPGDELRVDSEVLEVGPSKSRPNQGLVKLRTTTLNLNNEPVQVMIANLVVQRRKGE